MDETHSLVAKTGTKGLNNLFQHVPVHSTLPDAPTACAAAPEAERTITSF